MPITIQGPGTAVGGVMEATISTFAVSLAGTFTAAEGRQGVIRSVVSTFESNLDGQSAVPESRDGLVAATIGSVSADLNGLFNPPTQPVAWRAGFDGSTVTVPWGSSYDLSQDAENWKPWASVITIASLPVGLAQANEILTHDGVTEVDQSNTVMDVNDVQFGSPITTLLLSGSAAGDWVTVGIPFAAGAVSVSDEVVVTDQNDNPISTQYNALSTFRNDAAAVFHAALTFQSQGNQTYKFVKGGAASGTAITKSDVVSSAFDAVCQVVISGSTYSLSAEDLLDGTVTPLQDYTHLSGPLCSEFIVGGFLRLNGTGAAHPHLSGYFHVRAYGSSGSVVAARCDVHLENTGVYLSGKTDFTGNVTMSVGGVTERSESSALIYAGKKYSTRGWWGVSDPAYYARHDHLYIQDCKAVNRYMRTIPANETELNNLPQTRPAWNGIPNLALNMSSGGSADWIGLLDKASSLWLTTGDERAFKGMYYMQDQYQLVQGGTATAYLSDAPYMSRDMATGYPIDMATPGYENAGTSSSFGDFPSVSTSGNGSTPNCDNAHCPHGSYVHYLLTADFTSLENQQFYANHALINPNSTIGGGAGTWPRYFMFNQVRGAAWALANVIYAACITPDSHPLRGGGAARDPYDVAAKGNWDHALVSSAMTQIPAELNMWDYSGGNGTWNFVRWELSWLVLVIGTVKEMGYDYPALNSIWDRIGSFYPKLFGQQGSPFCWRHATFSDLYWSAGSDRGTPYTTWAQVANDSRNNFGESSCPASGAGGYTREIGLSGNNMWNTHPPGTVHAALPVAVNLGVSGASEAWAIHMARLDADNTGDVPGITTLAEWSEDPKFAFEPRP